MLDGPFPERRTEIEVARCRSALNLALERALFSRSPSERAQAIQAMRSIEAQLLRSLARS